MSHPSRAVPGASVVVIALFLSANTLGCTLEVSDEATDSGGLEDFGDSEYSGARDDLGEPGDLELAGELAFDEVSNALTTGQLVRIMAVHSGRAVEVSGNSLTHGTPVQQWDYIKTPSQRWKLRSVGSSFELQNVNSGKCMGISRASKAQGAAVLQGNCTGAADQQWFLRVQPNGTYQIANHNSKRCLDVAGAGKANGVKLQQYTCSTQAQQRFRIESVDRSGQPVNAPAVDSFVRRQGMRLMRNGQPFRFAGVNTYYLAGLTTKYPVTCGWPDGNGDWQKKLDAYFAGVKGLGANTVRFWAFQTYAGPSGKDFAFLDRIIQSAKKYGILLIPVLVNSEPHCEPGNSKLSDAFFIGGYKTKGYRPGYPLSYRDYVAQITAHFAKEPTLLMWQIGNELHMTYDRADRVKVASAFSADIATLMKKNAPNTLVSVGTQSDTNGGFTEWDYSGSHAVHAHPQVDLVELHDYFAANEALHAKVRMTWSVALQLGKPLFVGEQGIETTVGNYSKLIQNKLRASAALGTAGYLIWHFEPNQRSAGFNFNGASTDPLSRVFRADHGLFIGAKYPSALDKPSACSVHGERGCDTSTCCAGLTCKRQDEFGSYLCE